MPILDVLKNKKLFKVCVVITRYFGGIKLGAGGLVRAYADSTAKGVECAKIANFILSGEYKVKVSFSSYQKVLKYLNSIKSKIINSNFLSDGVELTFVSPKENEDNLMATFADYSAGKSTVLINKYDYFGYKNEKDNWFKSAS